MSVATAIRFGDPSQLPSRRDEDWRWTDLRGLIRQIPPEAEPADISEGGTFSSLQVDEEYVVNNGHIVGWNAVIAERLGETARLRVVATEAASNSTTVLITVRPGASLVLFETYEALGDGALNDINLDIEIGEGGTLERIVLADDQENSVTVSVANVRLASWSTFEQTVVTSGARRQRLETRVAHPGAGASVKIDGVYVLKDKRHADLTTLVQHTGPAGETRQLTKGVASGQARGVFQGRITVDKGADKTDARMGHHALLLSDRAEVDAKPELEIYADDVACAHGNSIGALDADALFYAMSRGLPEPEARALLTEAFLGQVVDRIGHDGAREIVRGWLAERLGALA